MCTCSTSAPCWPRVARTRSGTTRPWPRPTWARGRPALPEAKTRKRAPAKKAVAKKAATKKAVTKKAAVTKATPKRVPKTEPLLRVRDLRAGYGALPVLHGISFDVNVGETAVFLGLNGAGKSTTVLNLCGAVRPTGGTIEFDGKDTAGW